MNDEYLEAADVMQSYIEEHIDEPISLADLSKQAMFSPWYCAKIFKQATSLSPGDYIRKLKLSRSALMLRDEKISVTELAFALGYESVEGYQRAFRRMFECNPSDYAKHKSPIYLFTPYRAKYKQYFNKENGMQGVKNVFLQVIEKPDRCVLIKRSRKANDYMSYMNEMGCDLWGLLVSIKGIGNEPVCMWLPKKMVKPNSGEYVMGVEVENDYSGEIPEGFEIIKLEKCKYLMFQGEPFREEDYCEAISAVQDSMDKYDPKVIGYAYDKDNPRIQLEPIGTRGYIEMLAVKEIGK